MRPLPQYSPPQPPVCIYGPDPYIYICSVISVNTHESYTKLKTKMVRVKHNSNETFSIIFFHQCSTSDDVEIYNSNLLEK